MLRILKEIPTYAYVAGLLGAAATYIFYSPSSSDKKKRQHPNECAYPRGLINYKNECFINVILQSLASSNKVTEWLVHSRIKSTCIKTNLFDSLGQVIAAINKIGTTVNLLTNQPDEYQCEFYAAQSIKQALNAHNWHIQSEEHDCHEFFHLIMDVLDEEQLENKKSFKSLNYFQPSNLKESSRLSSKKNPFHGYLALQFQCLDCNYKYPLKLESFYSLSLTIPHKKDNFFASNSFPLCGTTLFECLNNFFKTEILTEMKCENCAKLELKHEKKKGIMKRQAIAKLPECLCVQIQRNSWSDLSCEMIKKTNFVQFPLKIKIDNNSKANMSNFSLKQVGIGGLLGGKAQSTMNILNENKNTNSNIDNFYELRSAVVHYGSALSGHFVVFRKMLSNEADSDNWLQISDNDIKLVKQSNLLNSNVYMLFYDKMCHLIN